MREGWNDKKLSEVCEKITDGTHQTPTYFNDGIIFLSSKNVTSGRIDWDNVKYIDSTQHSAMHKRVAPRMNDILLAKNGTTGVAAIVDRDTTFDIYVSLALLRPLSVLHPTYLLHFINSPLAKAQFNKRLKGIGVPNLHLEEIREVQIPFPDLLQQKRIVAILDEAFAAIDKAKANLEKNLQNAKELFETYLEKVFANGAERWEEKTLEQVSKTFGRGKSKHRPRNFEGLYGGKYPFIQTGDIRNCDHYITEYTQTYNELGLAQSRLWPAGTICITIAANIAETGLLTFDACFPDSVIGMVVNEKLANRDFVEYLLQSFKARIQSLGKGSAQANINMGTFENEFFPFPPVEVQQDIVQKLDALSIELRKLETFYQQKLTALAELKKSILQKAFAGELTASQPKMYPVPPTAKVVSLSPTDTHAAIISLALLKHSEANRAQTFGHVKSEKIVNMVQYMFDLELARQPVKEPAGPNDFPRLKAVESRAKLAGFFYVNKRGGGYDYTLGTKASSLIEKLEKNLGADYEALVNFIGLMIPLDTKEAEVRATVYSSWNNLLLDGATITDEAIVYEAREAWHPDKLKIPREKFFEAIEWIKANDIVPKGNGKKVEHKTTKPNQKK